MSGATFRLVVPVEGAQRWSKLDAAQVAELRRRKAAGEPQTAFARAYGISEAQVSRIVRGEHW